MSIDIVLVDDHLPFRVCLKGLLEQQPDFAVVAQADHGGQVVGLLKTALRTGTHCVVLMDVNLPTVDGIEGTRRVIALALAPMVQVLALSSHDDAGFVAAMMAAGACGYMLKDDPLDELVSAIRDVAAGRRVFSRALSANPPGVEDGQVDN